MDLRKERTLKYLSQSLVDLMGDKPLAHITVREICDNAMVRRATFYRHFKSKDELLSYVLAQRREAIRERSREVNRDLPISQYCSVMVRELVAYIKNRRPVIERQRLNPEFATEIQLIVDDIGRDFACRLEAANEPGAGEPAASEPHAETLLLANFYAAGLMGAVRWWFNECGGQDEELLIKALDDVSARLFG